MIGVISDDAFGFPYSGKEDALAQKRLVIMKTERKFENIYITESNVDYQHNSTDNGFYFLRWPIHLITNEIILLLIETLVINLR